MCTDKTGTLTEASLRVVALIPADGTGKGDLAQALGHFAGHGPTVCRVRWRCRW